MEKAKGVSMSVPHELTPEQRKRLEASDIRGKALTFGLMPPPLQLQGIPPIDKNKIKPNPYRKSAPKK